MLLNGQKHYQSDLASEFICSPQTIIRIMADIESVIGINLESGIKNKRKWYRIASRSPRQLGLDFEELRYLSVCRDLAAQTLPKQILSRVDETIFNLSMNMSSFHAANQSITFLSKGRIDYTPYFPFIEKLLNACENGSMCLVRYRALGKQESKEHRFVPHKLLGMNQALYVIGTILQADAKDASHFTNLAVHRMKEVIVTDKKVEVEFSETTSNTFGLPWHEPRTFKIHFKPGKAADYVAERIWSETQKIEKLDDGSIILHIKTCSEPELMAWIRSFGDYITAWSEIAEHEPAAGRLSIAKQKHELKRHFTRSLHNSGKNLEFRLISKNE